MFFLHHAFWYNYATQTNEMQNILNYYLIFNLFCLLNVSNRLGSSSGRQLYMQYCMFYMHRYEQSGG
jgi:putative flippase GtrA